MNREEAIQVLQTALTSPFIYGNYEDAIGMAIEALQAQTDGDMGEVSDGYHTFNQLYHQRAVLFAIIVNQNKDKAWKSWKHEDGKFCFDKGGEWFIVGVDTPDGSYTYHYENKYWDMFDCKELDRGKHWDGHTEEDVTRLLSLPPVEPKAVCEDNISRQDAIDAIERDIPFITFTEDPKRTAQRIIGTVPSADRPTGEWVNRERCQVDEDAYEVATCSECGAEITIEYPHDSYCPNCGARMEGGDTE